MKFLSVVIILTFGFYAVQAQNIKNNSKFNIAFIKFFEGDWSGVGQFSNGKKIEAEASFKLSLDSCWVIYTHTDKAPNSYKSVSVWGIDKLTGKFLDYIFDNFQGHRLFNSDGWESGRLVLVNKVNMPTGTSTFERFTYLKTGADKFKMSYEVSNDEITWRLGDFVDFIKNTN